MFLGQRRSPCASKLGHKVFFVQWAFMLASSILAYFYIGDFIQGKPEQQTHRNPNPRIKMCNFGGSRTKGDNFSLEIYNEHIYKCRQAHAY
jgi:hypothetical protein